MAHFNSRCCNNNCHKHNCQCWISADTNGCSIQWGCETQHSLYDMPHKGRLVQINELGEILSIISEETPGIYSPPLGSSGLYQYQYCCNEPPRDRECEYVGSGFVTEVELISGGSGYSSDLFPNPPITVTTKTGDGGGLGLDITIEDGEVKSVKLRTQMNLGGLVPVELGYGYNVGDIVEIEQEGVEEKAEVRIVANSMTVRITNANCPIFLEGGLIGYTEEWSPGDYLGCELDGNKLYLVARAVSNSINCPITSFKIDGQTISLPGSGYGLTAGSSCYGFPVIINPSSDLLYGRDCRKQAIDDFPSITVPTGRRSWTAEVTNSCGVKVVKSFPIPCEYGRSFLTIEMPPSFSGSGECRLYWNGQPQYLSYINTTTVSCNISGSVVIPFNYNCGYDWPIIPPKVGTYEIFNDTTTVASSSNHLYKSIKEEGDVHFRNNGLFFWIRKRTVYNDYATSPDSTTVDEYPALSSPIFPFLFNYIVLYFAPYGCIGSYSARWAHVFPHRVHTQPLVYNSFTVSPIEPCPALFPGTSFPGIDANTSYHVS